MNELFLLIGAAVALAAVLANIGIWSPRRLWVKLTAVIVVALFAPVAYGGFAELLGKPKPVTFEWANRNAKEAEVLGSKLIENEAIYLWLALPGVAEPLAYVLPWSDKLARQLHKAGQEAEAKGQKVAMRKPFENSLDQMQQVFYPKAHQAPPPKQVAQDDGPLVFRGTVDTTSDREP